MRSRARSRYRRNPDEAATIRDQRLATRAYSALHDGLLPERTDRVPAGKFVPDGYLVHLGRRHAEEYYRRVDDDGDGKENPTWELYRHEYAPHAAPDVYYDRRGKIFYDGGHYRVTERGITDMKRHGRHYLGFIPRVNPDYTRGQVITRVLGITLGAVVVNKALDTVVDPFLNTDRSRSLTKAGVAAVLGLAFAKRYPFLAGGMLAAGALELFQLGYREFGLDRYEAMARDKVAQLAARIRGGGTTTTTTTTTTQGVYGMDGGRAATGALGAGGSRMAVDPAAIRRQMNAAPATG